MLAPRASGAYVCLRCELQLARRRLPPYTRPTYHANFSTTARRRDDVDKPKAPSRPATTGLKRLTKEFYKKGKLVRETSARLGGLKTLGDDSEILVVRQVAEYDDTPAEPKKRKKLSEPIAEADLYASVEQEQEDITPEEVRERIDVLRPESDVEPGEPQFVSQNAFIKLKKDLVDGFSSVQLAYYYSNMKNFEPIELHNDSLLPTPKAEGSISTGFKAHTQWHPGTTPIHKRANVRKWLLVDRILRNLWKLVPQEEVEAPGEIEIRLEPWLVTLLNAGENETILRNISETRKARLEIHQQHSILRITADKTSAEYAAHDVQKALRSVVVKKFQLRLWLPCLEEHKIPNDKNLTALYTNDDFNMIASSTRTSIQSIRSRSYLILRGLDKSAVEEAERMLIRLLPLKDPSYQTGTIKAILRATKNQSTGPAFLAPLVDDSSLDYQDRRVKSGRWTFPVVKISHGKRDDSEETVKPSKASARDNKKRDLEATKRAWDALIGACKEPRELPPQKLEAAGELETWDSKPEFKISAEFGQILVPLDEAAGNEHTITQTEKKLRTHSAIFASQVPGLTSLLVPPQQPSDNEEAIPSINGVSRTAAPSLFYNFIPAPLQKNFDPGQLFPQLRIQMRTSPNGGKATLHRLTLTFQQHMNDVLLPHKAVDIRFTRRGRLTSLKKQHSNPNVHGWAHTVCKNIASGERLTAPPLTIDVPAWTIPGLAADAKETRQVTYLFSRVSFKQAVQASFMDTVVAYNTIQSGKLGARGGSLCMYSDQAESIEKLFEDEDGVKKFIDKSFVMADRITQAAGRTTGVGKMVGRPRNEDSERRIRRAEERARAAAEGHVSAPEQLTTEGTGASKDSAPVEHDAAGDIGDPFMSSFLTVDEQDALYAMEEGMVGEGDGSVVHEENLKSQA